MIEGKTSSGFEFKVDETLLEDFLFMRAFKMANSSDPEEQVAGTVDLVRIMFNNKAEEERYYQHLAKQHGGRVPADIIGQELGEIIDAAQNNDEETKN